MEFLLEASPVVYVLFVVVGTMFFVPGSVSMMAGGFLFGFWPGFIYAAIAIPLGAQAAFEAARWIVRPWVQKKVEDNARMRAIERALDDEAMLIIVLTRLSLPVPYNVLNYLYGATSVRAPVYFVATTIGMLPAVALYVYLGSIARDLQQILSGEATPPALGYWIFAIGAIAMTAAMWVVHRTATRALQRHFAEEASNNP